MSPPLPIGPMRPRRGAATCPWAAIAEFHPPGRTLLLQPPSVLRPAVPSALRPRGPIRPPIPTHSDRRRRVNVAVSRAKKKLVFVGSRRTLAAAPTFRANIEPGGSVRCY